MALRKCYFLAQLAGKQWSFSNGDLSVVFNFSLKSRISQKWFFISGMKLLWNVKSWIKLNHSKGHFSRSTKSKILASCYFLAIKKKKFFLPFLYNFLRMILINCQEMIWIIQNIIFKVWNMYDPWACLMKFDLKVMTLKGQFKVIEIFSRLLFINHACYDQSL